MQIPLIILAGGKATRLGALSEQTPKFLMPVSATERFADLQLNWARSNGFRHVILSIAHLGEQIQAYCGDGSRFGIQIDYAKDGVEPAGTGGAVAVAAKGLLNGAAVTYGDTLLQVPFPLLEQKLNSAPKAWGLMTVFKNTVPGHKCNAVLSGDFVTYDKKNPASHWQHIDYGFLVLRPPLLKSLQEQQPPFDLSEPLSEASKQKKILGLEVSDRFWEIGSPEALAEFRSSTEKISR